MGSGVSSGDLRFTHAGGLDNYSSISIMFPADRSSVVLLCSFNNNNTDALFNFVMGIRGIMLTARRAPRRISSLRPSNCSKWTTRLEAG